MHTRRFLVPLIALAAVEVSATPRRFHAAGAWLLVSAALTLLVYEGGGSVELRAMSTWVMAALLARNVMYVALWVYLVVLFARRDLAGPAGASIQTPRP